MPSRYVRHDGLVMRRGGAVWRWWWANRFRLRGKSPDDARRRAIVAEAKSFVGTTEQPPGSNSGAAVRRFQSSTGAFGQPWCVSFVQYVWTKTLGSTYADRTANAYYLASYAKGRGDTIPKPEAGCAVVYHLGDGHAGLVVSVRRDGTFYAVEGNWGDAVVLLHRDPHVIPCVFVLRPELR